MNLIRDYEEKARWKYAPNKRGRMKPTERSKEIPALTAYTVRAFERAGFRTLEQVAEKTEAELLSTRYLGRKCVKQVKPVLKELELTFGTRRVGNC